MQRQGPQRRRQDLEAAQLAVALRWWSGDARGRVDADGVEPETDFDDDDDVFVDGAEPPIGAGNIVSHASFGVGRVVKADGSGRDTKLLINFERVGLKTVLARFVDVR